MNKTKSKKHFLMAGHGRGYEIVRNDPQKYRKYVMDMCVNDTSFDMQCEGSRAAYTYDLTMLYEDYKPFLNKAIRCFEDDSVDTDWHLFQHLTDLLTIFAFESSEKKAEKAILKKYDRIYEKLMTRRYSSELHQVCQCFEVLMIELVNWYEWDRVEKIAHDLGAWFIRRKTADKEDLKWLFGWLWSVLEDKYGESELRERLEKSALTSKETAKFVSVMYIPAAITGKKQGKRTPLSAEDILNSVRNGEIIRGLRYSLKNMSEAEKNKLSEVVDSLIEYSGSDNKEIRNSAINVLTNLKDDRIGAFAKAGIAGASKEYYSSYVEMLINNCRPEDEEFLLNELNKIEIDQDDKCGWHGIVMNIVHVRDEDIPNSILNWAYENSLCSCCREHITESMLRKGLLTPELRQECLHDANLEIRDMVEE